MKFQREKEKKCLARDLFPLMYRPRQRESLHIAKDEKGKGAELTDVLVHPSTHLLLLSLEASISRSFLSPSCPPPREISSATAKMQSAMHQVVIVIERVLK